jgi:hypothetical protein
MSTLVQPSVGPHVHQPNGRPNATTFLVHVALGLLKQSTGSLFRLGIRSHRTLKVQEARSSPEPLKADRPAVGRRLMHAINFATRTLISHFALCPAHHHGCYRTHGLMPRYASRV